MHFKFKLQNRNTPNASIASYKDTAKKKHGRNAIILL